MSNDPDLLRDALATLSEATPVMLQATAELDRLRAEVEAMRVDALRLTYLEGDAMKRVFKIGKTWYWKPAYGQPHRKAKTLRAAIDAAMQEPKP